MGKQEFTKEQIEFIRNDFRESPLSWDDYLDSLLKPETKFIDVRIECGKNADVDIYLRNNNSLPSWLNDIKYKATELTEVFSIQDIENLKEHLRLEYGSSRVTELINNWLSERKSK
jgi:hypothetical protein